MPGSGALAALAAVLLPVSAAVAAAFATLAPEPYMDEPFHVPQTQRYCAGRWREWDPKITTFPGLYVFGAALGHAAAAARRALGVPLAAARPLCGTTTLRAVNLLFAAACLPLFWHAAARLDAGRSQGQVALLAAACFLFPLHFFFTFLYYTDVPSLFFSLAAHLAGHGRQYRLAAALGAAAVAVRQTNAVWVAFSLGTCVLDRCLPQASGSLGSGGGGGEEVPHGSSNAEKTGVDGDGGGKQGRRRRGGKPGGLLPDLDRLVRQAWLLRWRLAADLWPLGAVVAAFAAFVARNGGIVVGDRANHAPARHLAQPLYFLLYTTAWLAPAFWAPPQLAAACAALAAAAAARPGATAAALAAAGGAVAAAVARGTLAHPFLLADNRHLTFYLWRRLLNRTPWARYALLPAYLYSGWALRERLRHRGPLWLLGLSACTCLVLVPAHLLECRYFTTPFILALLHMRTPRPRVLAAVVGLFAAANTATLYLFLCRPFAWPDGSVARFIW